MLGKTPIAIVCLCASAASAVAQDRGAAVVGGSVSAANMDSRTDVAYAGTFGYRFNRVVGLEIEATLVPRVRSAFPTDRVVIQGVSTATTAVPSTLSGSIVQIYPTPFYANPTGRIVIFTNSARIEIPTTTPRVTPYFVAGGGVASVRRTADFIYPVPIPLPVAAPGVAPTPIIPQYRQVTQRVVSSSTDLAVTIGGGASIRVSSSFSVDADLRLFRLLSDDDRNLGRFGVGARYRF